MQTNQVVFLRSDPCDRTTLQEYINNGAFGKLPGRTKHNS